MKRICFIILLAALCLSLAACGPEFIITGKVVDSDSQPVSGAKVYTYPDRGPSCITLDDGLFEFTLSRGTYIVTAVVEGLPRNGIELAVEADVAGLEIALVPTHPVSGTVRDQDGNPIEGASVATWTPVDETRTGTDASGYYQIMVREGSRWISFDKEHFTGSGLPVNVAGPVEGLNAVLESSPASVSGCLTASGPAAYTALQKGLASLRMGSSMRVRPPSLPTSRKNAAIDGLVVKFREPGSAASRSLSFAKNGVSSHRDLGQGRYHVTVSGDPKAALAAFQKDLGVEYAQLNHPNYLCATPNDPEYAIQWNLNLAKFPPSWDLVKGSDGNIVVAVLDTGIRSNSDLSGNIVPGWNTVNNSTSVYDSITPYDQPSHGTHVASIIAAQTNNNLGLAGAGWNVKVMPVVVFRNVGGSLAAYDMDIAEGIRKAVDSGAKVINLSLGNHEYRDPKDHPDVESALQYAYQNNVSVFAATGNESSSVINYPASSLYAFAVGAVKSDGWRADYSNYGTGVNLMAPGGRGVSQTNDLDWIWGYSDGDIWGFAGTSQAVAHVSATAALLYTVGATTPSQIFETLRMSATPKANETQYGAGILNASAALQYWLRSRVRVCCATTPDGGHTWQRLTSSYMVDGVTGQYHIDYIRSSISGIYLIAYSDLDSDDIIEPGDFFGRTETGYRFTADEVRDGVNFTFSRITDPDTTYVLAWHVIPQ